MVSLGVYSVAEVVMIGFATYVFAFVFSILYVARQYVEGKLYKGLIFGGVSMVVAVAANLVDLRIGTMMLVVGVFWGLIGREIYEAIVLWQ